jgi:hypothetical protein
MLALARSTRSIIIDFDVDVELRGDRVRRGAGAKQRAIHRSQRSRESCCA